MFVQLSKWVVCFVVAASVAIAICFVFAFASIVMKAAKAWSDHHHHQRLIDDPYMVFTYSTNILISTIFEIFPTFQLIKLSDSCYPFQLNLNPRAYLDS